MAKKLQIQSWVVAIMSAVKEECQWLQKHFVIFNYLAFFDQAELDKYKTLFDTITEMKSCLK